MQLFNTYEATLKRSNKEKNILKKLKLEGGTVPTIWFRVAIKENKIVIGGLSPWQKKQFFKCIGLDVIPEQLQQIDNNIQSITKMLDNNIPLTVAKGYKQAITELNNAKQSFLDFQATVNTISWNYSEIYLSMDIFSGGYDGNVWISLGSNVIIKFLEL